jgi:myo-inositol-1(or 4)-monophosphatase
MQPLLNIAVRAARRAGDIIVRAIPRLEAVEIQSKGRNDFVTEVDRAAEADIIETIRRLHPDHAFLAEESGASANQSDVVWIIDPLDGTTNYAHGYPCFCVSMGLECNGRLELGVVYDPIRDEMFTAERGQGSALNGRRIRVSPTPTLASALLCTGFPYDVRERNEFARHFANFIMTAQGVRRDGAAALDLAYVAAGRFDGFWEEGLKAWDVAAGVLIIEEAGGRVSDFHGKPFDIHTPPIVASNGLIHDQMRELLLS